jgi:acyl carrier protein
MVQGTDWARFAPGFLGVRPSPVLNEIPGVRQALRDLAAAAPTESAESMRRRLAAMSTPERTATVVKLVRDTAATVLGHASADAVEPGRAFTELGFDSLNAVEFANRIAATTGWKVRPTLVFSHPTPAALADHLLAQAFDGADPVLAELSRLEVMLAGEQIRDDVAARLRALVATAPEAEPGTVGDGLLDASDDEVFEFISERFGIS